MNIYKIYRIDGNGEPPIKRGFFLYSDVQRVGAVFLCPLWPQILPLWAFLWVLWVLIPHRKKTPHKGFFEPLAGVASVPGLYTQLFPYISMENTGIAIFDYFLALFYRVDVGRAQDLTTSPKVVTSKVVKSRKS